MAAQLSQHLLLAVPLAPLVGAVVAGFFGKAIGRSGAHVVTVLGVLLSFVLSVLVLQSVVQDGADKALACGLVSAVVPAEDLLDTALALAGEMLLTSPMGLRLTKDALNLNIDAGSMEHAFALEDRQQVLLSGTADTVEAREAFFAKRPPVWGDR